MLGGMAAAGVVSAMFPGSLDVSTVLSVGMSKAQGLFLEMFLTSLLVFTIYMLAVEKHKATHIAPIGIGLAFFLAELVGLFYTGGSLNPARSFGPCVVTHSFPGYHYIYWIGPFMGTLLATGFYKLYQIMNYQTINPGQDFDEHEVKTAPLPQIQLEHLLTQLTGRLHSFKLQKGLWLWSMSCVPTSQLWLATRSCRSWASSRSQRSVLQMETGLETRPWASTSILLRLDRE
jgi:hypothetical protein